VGSLHAKLKATCSESARAVTLAWEISHQNRCRRHFGVEKQPWLGQELELALLEIVGKVLLSFCVLS
jgi:hypothetical protein